MNAVNFPFSDGPSCTSGEAIAIAPGVLWLRMPLFGSLAFINVWAMEDEQGWTIVDTGLHNPRTIAAWEAALVGPLAGRPVWRIICTHMHPDHCGMAGWLGAKTGAELWMSRAEYLSARTLASETGPQCPSAHFDFYKAAGWSPEQLDCYAARFGGFSRIVHTLPRAYRRLQANDELTMARTTWRVIVGSGHSPEHVCLWSSELGLFISGDQVLPIISSNVSVYPTEPEANPLADWMRSLRALQLHTPADVLVLPAHNDPFYGLHERLRLLAAEHRNGLQKVLRILHVPKRAVDVFSSLFKRTAFDDEILTLATGESLAHLHYLRSKGKIERTFDANGVAWWTRST